MTGLFFLTELFGETALIDEPVVIDGGVNFRFLDQSSLTEEHLIQTSIFVPNLRSPQTHLTYDFDLRLENAMISNQMDYSLELTTPIPLLKVNILCSEPEMHYVCVIVYSKYMIYKELFYGFIFFLFKLILLKYP